MCNISSRFDVWHHGIVNLQQAEDVLVGIVRKPMLRWTPGVFITPGTYHITKTRLEPPMTEIFPVSKLLSITTIQGFLLRYVTLF